MAQFSFQQEFQILKDVSLGAISIFTSLLAIVATARLLPQDIEDRTVYTILAKPVPRFEYVLGKIAGVLLLLAISTLVMAAAFLLVLYTARTGRGAHDIEADVRRAAANRSLMRCASIRSSAFNIDIFPGIVIIYLKACLLAALTLFVSTFATSNIFTIVVMAFIYFIGHLQATAREYWLQEHSSGLVTRVFLAIVALLFPDLQAFNLVDDIVARHRNFARGFCQDGRARRFLHHDLHAVGGLRILRKRIMMRLLRRAGSIDRGSGRSNCQSNATWRRFIDRNISAASNLISIFAKNSGNSDSSRR